MCDRLALSAQVCRPRAFQCHITAAGRVKKSAGQPTNVLLITDLYATKGCGAPQRRLRRRGAATCWPEVLVFCAPANKWNLFSGRTVW